MFSDQLSFSRSSGPSGGHSTTKQVNWLTGWTDSAETDSGKEAKSGRSRPKRTSSRLQAEESDDSKETSVTFWRSWDEEVFREARTTHKTKSKAN